MNIPAGVQAIREALDMDRDQFVRFATGKVYDTDPLVALWDESDWMEWLTEMEKPGQAGARDLELLGEVVNAPIGIILMLCSADDELGINAELVSMMKATSLDLMAQAHRERQEQAQRPAAEVFKFQQSMPDGRFLLMYNRDRTVSKHMNMDARTRAALFPNGEDKVYYRARLNGDALEVLGDAVPDPGW